MVHHLISVHKLLKKVRVYLEHRKKKSPLLYFSCKIELIFVKFLRDYREIHVFQPSPKE